MRVAGKSANEIAALIRGPPDTQVLLALCREKEKAPLSPIVEASIEDSLASAPSPDGAHASAAWEVQAGDVEAEAGARAQAASAVDMYSRLFRQIDTNGDGKVSQLDFIKALRQDAALAAQLV